MNIPVILYGDDGTLLSGIETQQVVSRLPVPFRTSARLSAWPTPASPGHYSALAFPQS